MWYVISYVRSLICFPFTLIAYPLSIYSLIALLYFSSNAGGFCNFFLRSTIFVMLVLCCLAIWDYLLSTKVEFHTLVFQNCWCLQYWHRSLFIFWHHNWVIFRNCPVIFHWPIMFRVNEACWHIVRFSGLNLIHPLEPNQVLF